MLTTDCNALHIHFTEESNFRTLFPYPLQKLDALHWSPLQVTCKAVQFPVQNEGVRI